MLRPLSFVVAASSLALASPAASQDAAADAWEAGDWSRATEIWNQRAADGDLDALYNLGQAFRLGQGVPRSSERAAEYYRAAAMQGHKDAAEQLGLIYYDVPETRRAAVELLRALAAEGRPRAAYVIGLEHMSGQILPLDYQLARYYLQVAADGGVTMAMGAIQRLPAPASVAVASPAPPAPAPSPAPAVSDEMEVSAVTPYPARETATAVVSESGSLGGVRPDGWAIWFGPFRDNMTAGVRFTRIAARAKLEGEAQFVSDGEGVRIVYGYYTREGAADFCDRLNNRRFQCRGVMPIAAPPVVANSEAG